MFIPDYKNNRTYIEWKKGFQGEAEEELKRMEEFRKAQAEIEKKTMQKRYHRKCLK